MRSKWSYLCPAWIFSKLQCSYQSGIWVQLYDYIDLFSTLEWKMNLRRTGAQQVLVAMATVLWRFGSAASWPVVKVWWKSSANTLCCSLFLQCLWKLCSRKFISSTKMSRIPRSKGGSWELYFKLTKFKLISCMSKQGNTGIWSCEWDFSHSSRRYCRHRSVLWWLQPYKTLEKLQQAALHS